MNRRLSASRRSAVPPTIAHMRHGFSSALRHHPARRLPSRPLHLSPSLRHLPRAPPSLLHPRPALRLHSQVSRRCIPSCTSCRDQHTDASKHASRGATLSGASRPRLKLARTNRRQDASRKNAVPLTPTLTRHGFNSVRRPRRPRAPPPRAARQRLPARRPRPAPAPPPPRRSPDTRNVGPNASHRTTSAAWRKRAAAWP